MAALFTSIEPYITAALATCVIHSSTLRALGDRGLISLSLGTRGVVIRAMVTTKHTFSHQLPQAYLNWYVSLYTLMRVDYTMVV